MSPPNEVVIDDIDELETLLARAYWIESEFENVVQWEAYSSVDDKYKDLLFELSHESEEHKADLKELISNIEGLDLETINQDSRAHDSVEFKKQTADEKILYEVYRNDKSALDLYQKIHSKTSKELINEVWRGLDSKEFFEILSNLIQGEKRHISRLKKYAQKFDPFI